MSMPKRRLRSKLKDKFGFEDNSGTRHDGLALWADGKKVAVLWLSRSHDVIDDAILREIARQCWVPLAFLREMVECTKSQAEYQEHLRKAKRLD